MAAKDLVQLQERLSEDLYSLPLHLQLSQTYRNLGYPDLAAGYAYKALLLIDEILEDSGEYHCEALEAAKVSLTSVDHVLIDTVSGLTVQDERPEASANISDDIIISIANASWRERA